MKNGGFLIKETSSKVIFCTFRHIQQPSSVVEWSHPIMEVVEIDNNLIAQRIRRLRQQKQWTQQELADRCKFPGPWKISRIESAKKGSGIERIDTLEIICEAMEIELWELLKLDV